MTLAEAKDHPLFELPKLIFNSSNQDPQVFGFLAHDSLASIVVDAIGANDHVHELHDIMERLSVPIQIVDGSRNS